MHRKNARAALAADARAPQLSGELPPLNQAVVQVGTGGGGKTMTTTALDKNGFFTEPPYISIGDPYKDPRPNSDDRFKGRQLQASVPKLDRDAPGYEGYLRLSEGDPYINPGALERKETLEKKKKWVQGPFIPPRPAFTGGKAKGDGSGCIGPPVEYINPVEPEVGPRVPKRTGKNFLAGKVPKFGADFPYVLEPYCEYARRELERKEREAKPITKKFNPAGHPPKFISEMPGASSLGEGKTIKFREEKLDASRPIFKPGAYYNVDKVIVEYVPDPSDERIALAKKQIAEEKGKQGPAWKPPITTRSKATKLIVT